MNFVLGEEHILAEIFKMVSRIIFINILFCLV